jgi:hypothetical protein
MLTGQQIMVAAGVIINDTGHVRWTLPELCEWLNEGVRQIVLAKPSASSGSYVLSLVAGTLQAIPQTGTPLPMSLLNIVRNIVTDGSPRVPGRSVTPTTHRELNANEPNWHETASVPFQKEVRHFIFDENNPKEFYVFPGNNAQGKVEAILSVLPAPVVAVGDVSLEASYAGSTGLHEIYQGPLTDYLCYRAHSKDDVAGEAGRANVHFAAFAAAVGLKTQVEAATSPNNRRGR